MRYIILSILIVFSLISPSRGDEIKVHLLTASKVNINSEGNLKIFSGESEPTVFKGALDFSLKDGNIFANGINPSQIITISSPESMPISVNSKKYRGEVLLIQRKPDSFFVINFLDMEDYLAGVLGGEMPSSWPIEALKAQAVAARTYGAMMKKTPRNQDFDLFSTTQDQVYTGISGEVPPVLRAISETSGEILSFDSVPINAFFHSTCSGSTSDDLDVFLGDAPYLTAVPCQYCGASSATSWNFEITRNELSNLLKSKGIITGELYDMKIAKTDSSGRNSIVSLITADGEKEIKGAELRLIIGAGKQKSTRYNLTKKQNPGEKDKAFVLLNKTVIKKDNVSKDTISIKGIELKNKDDVLKAIESIKSLIKKENKENKETNSFPPTFAEIIYEPEPAEIPVYSVFCFQGSGWGHGVGMCQWGAYGMAKEGFLYRDILEFYYPGTILEIPTNNMEI